MAAGKPFNPITNPSHYTQGKVECIEAIESALGQDGFIAYLRGQVIKYNWRLGLKDSATQDAGKAKFYQDLLVEKLLEKQLQTQKDAKEASAYQGAALTETQSKDIKNGKPICKHRYGPQWELSTLFPNSQQFYDSSKGRWYVLVSKTK